MTSAIFKAAALSALILTAGCALKGPGPAPLPGPGAYLAWPDAKPLSTAQLAGRLKKAGVVIVAETHNHPGHHDIQLNILKLMIESGLRPVVAVEWFDHAAQPACGKFSAGNLDLGRFAAEVDWKKQWGHALKLYAPLLEYISQNRLPLIAANAPAAVIRQVARKGLASLSPEQRSLLAPAMDLDDQAYTDMLRTQFKAHGMMGPKGIKDFAAAQIARDETMAHFIAQAMHPWPGGGKKAVVFVGAGHLAHGLGLPPRIRRRLPGVDLLTIMPVDRRSAAKSSMWGQAVKPADILAVSTPAPPRPPRLGVMIAPLEKGLLVKGVWPGTAAEKAGIKPGDILLSVDNKPLKHAKDIHDAVKSAPFKEHEYKVKRGSQDLVLKVTLEK